MYTCYAFNYHYSELIIMDLVYAEDESGFDYAKESKKGPQHWGELTKE